MRRFGLKIWNKDFIHKQAFVNECIKCVNAENNEFFSFVELFVLPNSFEETKEKVIQTLKGKHVVIHAPHSKFGMDTGNKERFAQNAQDLESSQKFADVLDASIIVLHPGFEQGEKYLEETIRQFKFFNDSRIAVENMPALCSSTGARLHGSSVDEVRKIKEETGCQFCFDFSHAVCAANYFKRDVWTDLKAYQSLSPALYHLCDGDFSSDRDEHRHLGAGNYDIRRIFKEIASEDALMTMETGSGDPPSSVEPWLTDLKKANLMCKR